MIRRYTCMSCNKGYDLDDPAFVYWRVATDGPWAGQNLDGRNGKPIDTLGWFAHCRDKRGCEHRRRNLHAGVAEGQIELVPPQRGGSE